MTTIAALRELFKTKLSNLYPIEEIEQFIFLVLEHYGHIDRTTLHAYPEKSLPENICEQINLAIERLAKAEPVQYILGQTEFWGLAFKVNSAVLIPRPETEELVDWILKSVKLPQANLLDVGTGSGAIPISIKKERPTWTVKSIDISADALTVARENARMNEVDIQLAQANALNPDFLSKEQPLDVVVSNPPYVCQKEKAAMQHNVLDWEPHLALFVSDEDPLLFYRNIALSAYQKLKAGGYLFFEINQSYGKEMEAMLAQMGYINIVVRKDLNGNDRMLKAQR